ncbi:MAG: hypothetical protein JWQ43_1739 [Glaciihabitans sp.]|nr:hypothetical protein [Glaciihabitans sp.]
MTAQTTRPRTAVISLCSTARLPHLLNQVNSVRRIDAELPYVVVWLDDNPSPQLDGVHVVRVPPTSSGWQLARGRNVGANAAIDLGAEQLVFLDADCVAGPELLARYNDAAIAHPGSILCGPVTYLPEDTPAGSIVDFEAVTRPHAARPAPPAGATEVADADQYPLFWSLSFALSADTWRRLGGFHEEYLGYGGEDTDFAFSARQLNIPLVWVGGAHAYHQYHPTSSPPWQHLDDILRNGALFAGRWGQWPMLGWLQAFEAAGAVTQSGDGWVRTATSDAAL